MQQADKHISHKRNAHRVTIAGRPSLHAFLRKGLHSTIAIAAIGAVLPAFAIAQQAYGPSRDSEIRKSGYGQFLTGQQSREEQEEIGNIGASPGGQQRSPKRGGRPFNYTLTVTPQLTYSDNVTLAPDGQEQADGLASVAFQGGLLVDRVGFSGIVNGRLELGSYFDQPQVNGEDLYEQFVVDQNITAAGTARVIEDLLYLDMAANITQEALSQQSQFSGQSIAANDSQADSFSYSISPYLFSRLINDGTVEARYRYTNVVIDDDGVVDGIEDFLNDSESHEFIAEYDSGRLLDKVGFSVRAYANKTEETGSERLPEVDFEQQALSWAARYALSRKVSVVGTLGYDEIDTGTDQNFDDDDLSGVFWKAGLLLTPGRRTSVQLEVGDRYGGALVEGSAQYKYSSRLQFNASLQRNFRTGAQAGTAVTSVLQSDTLAFAEELRRAQDLSSREITQRTLQLNSDLQEFTARQSGLATTNSASASVVARTKRNNFVAQVAYDQSDFGFQETETLTLGGTWDRRLSRKLDVYARGNVQLASADIGGTTMDCIAALSIDPLTAGLGAAAIAALCATPGDLDSETQTMSLLGGVKYRLLENVAAFVELSRTQRFADNDAQEYEENALSVGLSFDF